MSARIAHTRDAIVDAAVEEVALMRALATWDGRIAEPASLPAPYRGSPVEFDGDLDGDGTPDVAGDFDGDGTPDLGGPAPPSTTGVGLGGTVAALAAALEPSVETTAPIAMDAALSDWLFRSAEPRVRDTVLSAWVGPAVVGVPSEGRGPDTSCITGEVSLRIVGTDRLAERSMEVACIPRDQIGADDVLFVRDLSSGVTSCSASVSAPGTFRAPFRADADDYVVLEVYRGARDLVSLDDCAAPPGSVPDRIVESIEVANGPLGPGTCDECARFGRTIFDIGAALRMPASGLGRERASAGLGELAWVAPALLDAANPVAWARSGFLEREDGPRSALVVASAGDPIALVAGSHRFAEAAGIVPFAPSSAPAFLADHRAPAAFASRYPAALAPTGVLAAFHITEGVARLARHPVAGAPLLVVDPDDVSEGRARFAPDGRPNPSGVAPPMLPEPLRWQRAARRAGASDDDALFAPRGGEPRSALVHVVMRGNGSHDVVLGTLFDEAAPFDASAFVLDAVGRFVGSRGTETPF